MTGESGFIEGLAARPTATESSSKLTLTPLFFFVTDLGPSSDMLEVVSEASPGARLARRSVERPVLGECPREGECFSADFAGDTERAGG